MASKVDEIQSAVVEVLNLEKGITELEQELAQNEMFQTFLAKQKEAKAQIADTWKVIEQQMIEHNVKSLKGDWGYITLAERTNYKADLDELPAKFIKKVADTTKIGNYHKLEDKLPKGVTISTTKYITKGIK